MINLNLYDQEVNDNKLVFSAKIRRSKILSIEKGKIGEALKLSNEDIEDLIDLSLMQNSHIQIEDGKSYNFFVNLNETPFKGKY